MISPCPRWLLPCIYVLYLGLASTASVPLFGEIDWMHEGERLGAVQVVLDGGLPFRDVYLPHGLFPEVIRPVLAFWMLGESIASDRIVGILIAPLAYVAAAFYLWRVFPSSPWRIAALVGFVLYPLQLIPRHIAVFLALGILTAWVYEQKPRQLFIAGLLSGLSYVLSTIGHATFLVGTVLLFPFVVTAERVIRPLQGPGSSGFGWGSLKSTVREVAQPLFGGLSLGLLPFLGYMGVTGTSYTFLKDLLNRMEADAYAFVHVWGHQSLPPFNTPNMIWYAIPVLYLVLAATIIIRVRYWDDRRWTVVLPTLLFGILSLPYALRAYTYWKLAIVSFPFVVCCMFILYVLSQEWADRQKESQMPFPYAILLGVSAAMSLLLLLHGMTREWPPQQVIPRFLLPVLALLILGAVGSVATGRLIPTRWHQAITVGCPMAALILAVWFVNDTKPQIVSAQLKKPRLVSDVWRLVNSATVRSGGLTRESPIYVQDETLSYLKTASREGRRVVILAVGAGTYYFLAGTSPPNRFPEVNMTLTDAWAQEVVEGLERTLAILLVACDDHGQAITGWPMKPILSRFIVDNYVDSGQRLDSMVLGRACPFSVWVHQRSLDRDAAQEPCETPCPTRGVRSPAADRATRGAAFLPPNWARG